MQRLTCRAEWCRSWVAAAVAVAVLLVLARAENAAASFSHAWGCSTAASAVQCYDYEGQRYVDWLQVTMSVSQWSGTACAKSITAAGNVRANSCSSGYVDITCYTYPLPESWAYVYWAGRVRIVRSPGAQAMFRATSGRQMRRSRAHASFWLVLAAVATVASASEAEDPLKRIGTFRVAAGSAAAAPGTDPIATYSQGVDVGRFKQFAETATGAPMSSASVVRSLEGRSVLVAAGDAWTCLRDRVGQRGTAGGGDMACAPTSVASDPARPLTIRTALPDGDYRVTALLIDGVDQLTVTTAAAGQEILPVVNNVATGEVGGAPARLDWTMPDGRTFGFATGT